MFSPRDYDRVANDTKIQLKGNNSKKGNCIYLLIISFEETIFSLDANVPLSVTTRHGNATIDIKRFSELAKGTNALFVEAPTEETVFQDEKKTKNVTAVKLLLVIPINIFFF